jgi:3'-phosphoadenosine 5'-phosphosulfate sulfotransferase (PAPS reductase)/FAD synthetase
MGAGRPELKDRIDKYGYVKWREVAPLQPDDFKKYSPEQMGKLKESLKNNGFATPLFVWDTKKENVLLDGYHRIIALKELEDIEGVKVPPEIPAIFVKCKDRKDAKKVLLILNSHYADITKKALFEFVSDLNFDELNTQIDIPQFDFDFRENDLDAIDDTKDDTNRIEFGDERDTESIRNLLSRYDKIICSFSGGKDSLAMVLYLKELGFADKMELTMCHVPLFGFSDEVEYSEYAAKQLGIKIHILQTVETEEQIIAKLKKRGYPGRMLNWCNSDYKVKVLNDYYKTLGCSYIMSIGTRAEESARRAEMRSRGKWGNRDFVFPIFDWDCEKVVKEINKSGIKVHHAYKVFNRFSCSACYQQTKDKWQKTKKYYPQEYDNALKLFAASMESDSFRNCDYSAQLLQNMVYEPKKESEEGGLLQFTEYWEGK